VTLSAGRRIGPYEILELVGVGGMGEVYEARDPRLDRNVAVKVLPEAFCKDEERVARFRREARLLAKLNHPSIASIYEVEREADVLYLVMEMVRGETLADRLSRGLLSWEEALPLFKQIAEALEEAHDKGIIHRDLKPANIKVTPEERVKILDFGLAKAFHEESASADSVDLSQSPTTIRDKTRAGAIMGTAAFMSPEQAKGKAVDKRADIWAFGCVLYEALTGRRAFAGETAAEILANVLKSEPDWDRLPAQLPGGVRKILERCLTKDRSRRLRDIGEAWVILDETKDEGESRTTDIVRPKRLTPAMVASFLLGALAAGLASWTLLRSAAREEVRAARRLSIKLPPSHPIQGPFALSPDGSTLVYVAQIGGRTRLVKRRLDENVSEEIPGTEDAHFPFFSPDGRSVGFLSSSDYGSSYFRDATLKKVSRLGGPVVTLAPVPTAVTGASWGDDGNIVFSSGSFPTENWLSRVSAAGGEPEALGAAVSGWLGVEDVLPGSEAVLLSRGSAVSSSDADRIVLRTLDGGEEQVLAGGGQARYVPTGHVVYLGPDNVLFAMPFDKDRLEVTGPPVPVLERVGDYSFSREGSLVYRLPRRYELAWVDPEEGETPIGPSPWPHRLARISPDGTRLVLNPRDNSDLWLYDIARGALTRLTFSPASDYFPLWTPDGKKIVYVSPEGDDVSLMWVASDGSGAPERILTSENAIWPYSWAGGELVVEENKEETGADISIVSMAEEREVRPFIEAPFDQTNPAVSPDGRWIAYESNESGRSEIWVQSFSGDRGRFQVSIEGGAVPLWGRDGRELFYRNGEDVMRVALETNAAVEPGRPTRLFSGDYRQDPGRAYELAPDGKRFLMMKPMEEELSTELVYVLNWFDELERLAPSN